MSHSDFLIVSGFSEDGNIARTSHRNITDVTPGMAFGG
jgi:hypothetical protein